MTKQDIVDWIRNWMKDHSGCRELDSMYQDFTDYAVSEDEVGVLTELIWDMNPLKYMTTIPRSFAYRTKLTNINLPDHVVSIGDWAFANCNSLTSINFAENSKLTSIGPSAFEECDSLTSIELPNSVISIGYAAFRYSGLTSVVIGNRVESIGDYAFNYCPNLNSVTIPDSVTSIGSGAFSRCGHLQITYSGTKQEWKNLAVGKKLFTGTYCICNCSDGRITL